ncbi:hypothetical protein KKE78_02985 [Patescibacteria group bacterium]|nr:hypothetical protein [Patescibacteria group bacterium]
MTRLLSIITLVLALALFPPAVLAVVSNNAVPGEFTYPIKRGLEDVIYAIASLNPNTKALFAKARSDRRFQEITVLLTQGKEVSKVLNELIEQTQAAANEISKVKNPAEEEKLISQLLESITKYDAGLAQVRQTEHQSNNQPTTPASLSPTAAPLLSPAPTPQASVPPVPGSGELEPAPESGLGSGSVPESGSELEPQISPSTVPSITPPSTTPTPSSVPPAQLLPPADSSSGNNDSDIDKTRNKLQKIKKQLQQQQQYKNTDLNKAQDKENKKDDKEKKNQQEQDKDKKDKKK